MHDERESAPAEDAPVAATERDIEELVESSYRQGAELLTEKEHAAMDAISAAHRAVCDVIRDGGDQQVIAGDIHEVVLHVHALQQMVMSQAAARAYPQRYRLLGMRVEPPPISE